MRPPGLLPAGLLALCHLQTPPAHQGEPAPRASAAAGEPPGGLLRRRPAASRQTGFRDSGLAGVKPRTQDFNERRPPLQIPRCAQSTFFQTRIKRKGSETRSGTEPGGLCKGTLVTGDVTERRLLKRKRNGAIATAATLASAGDAGSELPDLNTQLQSTMRETFYLVTGIGKCVSWGWGWG